MKICAVQGIIAMILCGMAMAHNNYAQLLDKKVTLSLKEVSIEEALNTLEVLTDLKFFYSVDQLNIKDKISFDAVDRSLREILDALLTPYQVYYKVHEKKSTITLKRKHDEPESGALFPDNKKSERTGLSSPATVTGKVTDAIAQQPMAGVNVIVKGTTDGTTTDADGNFNIVADDNDVLVFSFIGYTTFEIPVGGRTVINVVLEEDIRSLKEVEVNAGYYKTTRMLQTGNISKVESEDIARQPVSNPLAALQGRVPGLEIVQSTGVPGGNFKVRIRGTNSIANGNDPLYIIDGVPYTSSPMTFNETSAGILGNSLSNGGTNPLNSINPADIESIEVLKDADATAIYGSRGSNGIILITTKKGQAGKTKVDINFYTGVGSVVSKLEQLNTLEYVAMRNEAFANDNVIPTTANARDLLVWDTTHYTNWQDELIGGTAGTTDAQVSVSGGDQYTQFSAGAGYHKETTVFPGDNRDQRISAHVSVTNTSSNQKLRTSVSVNYTANDADLLNKDLTGTALFLPPNAPALYHESGYLNWDGWNPSGPYENPLAYLYRRYEAKTNTLIGSAEVGYSILANLELKSRLGYTNMGMNATNLTPLSSLAPSVTSTSLNTARFSNSTFQNWMIEPQANWKPKLGNGRFDVLLGTQFLDQTAEGLAQTATGFSSEALMKNIAAAPNRTLGTNYYTQYRYHAVFGRINYNHSNKYIINITGRRDGSSRFGPGKQFANFGAVGAAWVFSNENFIKNGVSFFSFGKLRGSYGVTGNDQLTDYQYLDAYTSSSGPYQDVIGLTPVRLSNPDFAWETNKKLEAGFELGFVEDRILSSVSFYRNRSSNQLVGYPLPPTTGFTSIQANFPATVQNTGVEIELNTINLQHKGFTWTTALNISVPRNKLVEFPDLEASPVYANRYVVGEPLSIAKLYHYTGVDPAAGIYQFEDVNEDGNLDVADQQTIKFTGPKFFGGFQNSFDYKGFQIDVLFQFAKQNGRNYIYTTGTPGYMFNQPDYVLNRWQTEADITDIQRFGQSSGASAGYGQLQASDRSVSDASFIRLKNLSISYVLPTPWIGKMGILNARMFIQGQNLITITNYKGLDPEAQGSFLPPLRILTGGISLTF